MQNILTVQPMVADRHLISPNLMCTIAAKKSNLEIMRALNYTADDQFISDVEYLIQTGHPITKDQIKTLCSAPNVDFDEFRNNIDDSVMQASLVIQEMIADICSNYHERTSNHISHTFVRLVVAYCKVRDHIDRLDVPYFDYDESVLKKAQKMLADERIQPSNHIEVVPPYRPHNGYGQNIVDMFFGDCVFCDHDGNYDSNNDDSNEDDRFNLFEYDGYGSDDAAGEDSAQSSSNEVEEISDPDRAQHSDQEYEDFEILQREPIDDERVPDIEEIMLNSAEYDDDTSHHSSDGSPTGSDESESEGSIDGVIAKRRRIS